MDGQITNENIYSKRVIAFIDILGFKDQIEKTVGNNDNAINLLKSLEFLANVRRENYEDRLSEIIGKEVTVFSDSVVISYPINVGGSVFGILLDLIHIQLGLLFKGILFRGGLVVGSVYHKDNIVFGPGMVQAYKLESEHAIYPRIILTKDTIVEGIRHNAEQNTYEEELEFILGLVRKDEDEYYFIDYLKQWQELEWEIDYYKMLDVTRKIITTELSRITNGDVMKKYLWLKDYYKLVIDDLKMDEKLKKRLAFS